MSSSIDVASDSRATMREISAMGGLVTALPDNLTAPLYTITQASKILDVPAQTLSHWARGYEYTLRSGERRSAAPLVTEYGQASRHVPTVPFVGLAEATFLASLRAHDLPMQRIRPALAEIKKHIGLDHALASEALYTDGAEIILDLGKAGVVDVEPLKDLVVARNQQGVIVPAIQQYLKHITYGPSGYAESITLPSFRGVPVVVDPTIAFGRPHLADSGVEVDVVLERFKAGDSIDLLAEDFHLTDAVIEELLRPGTRLVGA